MCGAAFNALTIGFQAVIRCFSTVAVNVMRILLLGPVELWVGERQAALGGRKQRTLLALLALERGEVVSRDRAAEVLWGETLPEGHAQRLHTVVSRLRAAVRAGGGPAGVVETAEVGYRLRVDDSEVDTARAAAALHQARELRRTGRPAEASAAAREALDLWRGPPLADLLDNGWAGDHLRRLADLRLSLLEEEFDSRLALGASPGLVEDLEAACAEAPLRERLHAQLMLALDATGRRADALHAYDRVRRRLSDELGIEPGATLREAHRAVLGDESAGHPPPIARIPRRAARRVRRALVIAAVFAGAVAATAGVLVANGGGGDQRASLRVAAGELVIAAPDLGHARAEIPLSGTIINEQPGGLVLARGSLWSVTEKGTVTQVDLVRRRAVGSTPLALPAGPGGMAVGLGATWVTDSGSPTLYRLASGVAAARPMRLPWLEGKGAARTGGVAVGAGSLWVARAGTVDRLSRRGRLEHRFRIPAAEQVVRGGQSIWVVSPRTGVVTRLDPRTNTVRARIRLRPIVCCLAFGGGSAWATSEATGLLWQLRPDGGVQDVVHVPAPATEVAYANGDVWVSGYTGATVTRVDAQTLKVRVIHTDQAVAGLAASSRVVAFSTFPNDRAALAGVRGAVARIVLPHDIASDTDPATPGVFGDADADRQNVAPTCLSLYEYRGGRVAPYAASGPPARASSGRVWTIRVRPGFAFSPPSHEPVDAATFAATIERSTAPALRRSEAADALADVVGIAAYRRGLTAHVAGIKARGDLLTIRLRRPVTDLDARLSSLPFCAVPKDTPAIPQGLQGPMPSAGPYYVAGESGGAFEVLRRNPYYPGATPAGFDAVVYRFNVDPRRALDMVRDGRADYAAFYDREAASAARIGATAEANGIRFRLSPRPGRRGASILELFGRRVGCRSYSPLYAGVQLKRLCPVAGGR